MKIKKEWDFWRKTKNLAKCERKLRLDGVGTNKGKILLKARVKVLTDCMIQQRYLGASKAICYKKNGNKAIEYEEQFNTPTTTGLHIGVLHE